MGEEREGGRDEEREGLLVRINWNDTPLYYAEGTLDNIITASEKSTTTKDEDDQPKQAQPSVEQEVMSTEPPEVVDIDLSDPEVQKAASKIQARFRSHLKREEAKKNGEEEEEAQSEVVDDKETLEQTQNELLDLDLDDPELNKAASVIQSNFRTYLNEKNKPTEHAETEKESEGIGDDTEPLASHTEDPDVTAAESTTDKITTETEESSTDEQIPPPAEAQEETEGKEEGIPEPTSPENQANQVEQDGEAASSSQPVADEEPPPQPAESETGEGAGGSSKEAEPQAEGGESEGSPETNEEAKGEESGGEGSTSNGDGGGGGSGGGEVEQADDDTAVAAMEQVETTAGDGKEGAPEVYIMK